MRASRPYTSSRRDLREKPEELERQHNLPEADRDDREPAEGSCVPAFYSAWAREARTRAEGLTRMSYLPITRPVSLARRRRLDRGHCLPRAGVVGRGDAAADSAPPFRQRTDVDSIKGAIELRDLLEKRATAAADEPLAALPEVPANAPPVFHWVGVVPGSGRETTPPTPSVGPAGEEVQPS